MSMVRELHEDEVEFKLEVEQEDDIPVRGNVLASGDDKQDKEAEDEIIARLESGDVWAWACVTVTAKWKNFEGFDTLGCCSYTDEADFKEGDYYQDMKVSALKELNKNIAACAKTLEEIVA